MRDMKQFVLIKTIMSREDVRNDEEKKSIIDEDFFYFLISLHFSLNEDFFFIFLIVTPICTYIFLNFDIDL